MAVAGEDTLFDLPDLTGRDDSAHNADVKALWADWNEGTHGRVPVRLNTNPRMLVLDPVYNTRPVRFEHLCTDVETMAQTVLEWQYWVRHLLPGDHEKGLPESWMMMVHYQNIYDAAWFGCPVVYFDEEVPDTRPILTDDNKRMLFDKGLPEPFEGPWAEQTLAWHDYLTQKANDGWTFLGRPVSPPGPSCFCGCDGVFTVAANLRGATELLTDLLMDPKFAADLLEYVHQALVRRITAWREHHGTPVKSEGCGYADDSIALLSGEVYEEHVLPLHKRFYKAFGEGENNAIHLCGDAQRFFKTLRDQCGVMSFDTGFPVDFTALRAELGPEVTVSGGPKVDLFLGFNPEPLIAETQRICASGILVGGRFILQEANNLAPRANLDLCQAFYETGKEAGRLA
jgi:hypothetical protein